MPKILATATLTLATPFTGQRNKAISIWLLSAFVHNSQHSVMSVSQPASQQQLLLIRSTNKCDRSKLLILMNTSMCILMRMNLLQLNIPTITAGLRKDTDVSVSVDVIAIVLGENEKANKKQFYIYSRDRLRAATICLLSSQLNELLRTGCVSNACQNKEQL